MEMDREGKNMETRTSPHFMGCLVGRQRKNKMVKLHIYHLANIKHKIGV